LAGESLDGGLLEFEEFSPSRPFSSTISAACALIVASSFSTCRSSRSMRSSVGLTHSLDHARSEKLIPSVPQGDPDSTP